ncbi:hypothetical protein FOA52_004373, partial [Chlamydomonas sp. UWO 241]
MASVDAEVGSPQSHIRLAVRAFWSPSEPGALLLAVHSVRPAGERERTDASQRSSASPLWHYQELRLSPRYETVSAATQEPRQAQKGSPPVVQSVLLSCSSEGLLAVVVNDVHGQSCVIMLLASRLQVLRHLLWQSFSLSDSGSNRVAAAAWLAGTRDLALVGACGSLGVVEHTGMLLQVALMSAEGLTNAVPSVGFASLLQVADPRVGALPSKDARYSLTSAVLLDGPSADDYGLMAGSGREAGGGHTDGVLAVCDGGCVVLLAYAAPPLPSWPLLVAAGMAAAAGGDSWPGGLGLHLSGDYPGSGCGGSAADRSDSGSPLRRLGTVDLQLGTVPPSPLAASLTSAHMSSKHASTGHLPGAHDRLNALQHATVSERAVTWPVVYKTLELFASADGGGGSGGSMSVTSVTAMRRVHHAPASPMPGSARFGHSVSLRHAAVAA